MYLTYIEFIAAGGIEIGETTFERHELRARKLIDQMTQGRIRDETAIRPCVKAAVRDLIMQSAAADDEDRQHGGREITSIGNDGVSIGYAAQGTTQERRERARAQIVREYLTGETDATGVQLLYAGVT